MRTLDRAPATAALRTLALALPTGRAAVVGFTPFKIYEREIRIIGSNSCADKFPAAVDMMADVHERAAVLLGNPFPVWDFAAAVDSMVAGHAVKTQLRIA